MDALGIIFSNIHDDNVPELTMERTMASIPFCGRYRLIDFPLSSMVNSGINKVGVITKSNYQSLMDHVGSGKDWDLARRHGGLIILPPFGVQESKTLYGTRLEALKTVTGFLGKSTEEYVVMSDSDIVCSMDFNDLLRSHVSQNADITLVYVKAPAEAVKEGANNIVLDVDKTGRITDMAFDPECSESAEVDLYANVCIMKRSLLLNLIADAVAHNKRHFAADILAANLSRFRIFAAEHKGYFVKISSLQSYYEESLKLLEKKKRDALFGNGHAVYTKVKDSAPTKYGNNCVVENSLIADGCEIEGEVYNSIIFRGVKVGKGTVVRDSVLMQGTVTGENGIINCIITDKNVIIKDRRVLSGCRTHPFFVYKNSVL